MLGMGQTRDLIERLGAQIGEQRVQSQDDGKFRLFAQG
jgi:hypothetical protein